MSFHPGTREEQGVKPTSIIRSTAKQIAKAYVGNPSGYGLQALLAVIVAMLAFGAPVHPMLYVFLLVLAAVRFHEWFKKEGVSSPLLGRMFVRLSKLRLPKKK